MNNKRNIFWVLLFLLVPLTAFGQADTVIASQYGIGFLNVVIANDTTASNARWVSHTRSYILERDGIYPWNAVCTLQNNRKLKLRAEAGSGNKPQIWMYDVGTTDRPVGTMVLLKSDDTLDIKDVDISGYNEEFFAENHGVQGQLFNILSGYSGSSMFFDNCILKSTNGNHIRADGEPKTIRVTNCIFGDMGHLATSNLGAGQAIDVRANVIETLDIQNNTFVNYHTRIIRHYQSGPNKIINLKFNHNTCINGMSYHGWLSLGSVGTAQINNNMLIDHVALGNDTASIRQAEFSDSQERDSVNGMYRITWITCVPPGPADTWEVKNNFYSVSDSGYAMFHDLPGPLGPPYYQNEGPACTWAVNAKLGADSLTAFRKCCIQPVNIPQLMTNFIRWLYLPLDPPDYGGGKEKSLLARENWLRGFISKGIYMFDYNRKTLGYYRDTLNCNFHASANLASAGSDGKVVGDTRWSFLGGIPGSTTIEIHMAKGWNLVSIPCEQVDPLPAHVFPGAFGSVFTYDPGSYDYAEATIIECGKSYWVFYLDATTITIFCNGPCTPTIACKAGWNLIGSCLNTIQVEDLILSNGMILGVAFKYDPSIGDYAETAVILPGQGTWIFLTEDCSLTLPCE